MATSKVEGLYSLEEAQDHIADVRGITDQLQEHHPFSDSQIPNTPGPGNGSALYSVNGAVQAMTDTGLNGPVPVTWTDTGTQSVTAASLTSLSAVYTVPANDAAAGSVYRLTAWGNGTWGSTQQALAFAIGFPGVAEFGAHQAVAAGALQVSAAFRWNAILWIMCLSAGVSASWHGSLVFALSESAASINAQSGSAANNFVTAPQGPSTNITQDSTVDNALSLIVNWGATTGGPTITCHGTFAERFGA